MSPSFSLLLLAKTITHPVARSLCDSWASCIVILHDIALSYFDSNLLDRGEAPIKSIQEVGSGLALKNRPEIAPISPSPEFYRGVKKCEMWPRFSTSIAFESSGFRKGAKTYLKPTFVERRWLASQLRPTRLLENKVLRCAEPNRRIAITQPCVAIDCAEIWQDGALWIRGAGYDRD